MMSANLNIGVHLLTTSDGSKLNKEWITVMYFLVTSESLILKLGYHRERRPPSSKAQNH